MTGQGYSITDRAAVFIASCPHGEDWPAAIFGGGTLKEPLWFIGLARHAGWDDELEGEQAEYQVSSILSAIKCSLFSTDKPCHQAHNLHERIIQSFDAASQVAAGLDTYCSAAVVIVTGTRVSLGAIGRAEAWIMSKEKLELCCESTVFKPGSAQNRGILYSSIGQGFRPPEVRVAETLLDSDAALLVVVGAEKVEKGELHREFRSVQEGGVSASLMGFVERLPDARVLALFR